jgi:hypothetical protein
MWLDEVLHHDFPDQRAARLVQDQKLVEYVHGLSENRLAARLDYATSSGAPQSQPLHHVLAHLFNLTLLTQNERHERRSGIVATAIRTDQMTVDTTVGNNQGCRGHDPNRLDHVLYDRRGRGRSSLRRS